MYVNTCVNVRVQAKNCNEDEFNASQGLGPGYYPLADDETQVDFTTWHTYTVEWTHARLVWFVDGIQVRRSVSE
jgi:beta-glucanase (GH16 family)